MSFVVTKLKGVRRSSRSRAASQLSGSAKGSRPVWRSNAPARVVKGGISLVPSFQPFTWP